MRQIKHTYQDPLELIWLHAAAQMGMRVDRSDKVFASWDGQGTLTIGTTETLDPDDTLAQMILHEMCHALVEGPDAFNKPDWGLDITDPTQLVHEHAALRLQAALAASRGLRTFFASTTNARKYYDALPEEPLLGDDDDQEAAVMARAGFERATEGLWAEVLNRALERTSAVAAIVADVASGDSLWASVR